MIFCRLVANAEAGYRYATLHGRQHLVVNTVMLVEGVHEGSQGAVLYQNGDIQATASIWDHKPVVVYHPTINGVGVTACQPAVLEARSVGIILNTRFEDNKLKTETWIDIEKANAVDTRIVDSVLNKKPMEVSTGLYLDLEFTAGTWNKEDYKGIARNYKPDHLALLPDQVGACSLADGAGLLVNSSGQITTEESVQNEASFSVIYENIRVKLREMMNKPGYYWDGWIEDIFSSFFIYYSANEYWMQTYKADDSGVEFIGSPVKVSRVIKYVKADGSFVGNSTQSLVSNTERSMKTKAQKVDELIATNSGWTNDERQWLMDQDDAKLDKMIANAVKPVQNTAQVVAAVTTTQTPPPVSNTTFVQNTEVPKVQTLNDYINSAPPELRPILSNAVNMHNAERTRLVEVIFNHKQNRFTKEYLGACDLATLQGMAALLPQEQHVTNAILQPTYFGQNGAPVQNTSYDTAPLVPPQ